jgi:hypothetical protein
MDEQKPDTWLTLALARRAAEGEQADDAPVGRFNSSI